MKPQETKTTASAKAFSKSSKEVFNKFKYRLLYKADGILLQKARRKRFDILQTVRYNISGNKRDGDKMKKQKKMPTAFEIAELIIKATVAIAALIKAIKWW